MVKFSGTDGSVLWRMEFNGLADFSDDQANAVAIDPSGDVFAYTL